MPKYSPTHADEAKEEKPAKTLISKTSVLSMTYFDADVPVTLRNPELNNVSVQDILNEEHKDHSNNNGNSVGSVGSKISPRAASGYYNGQPYLGDNGYNRNSVGSISSLQSHEKPRSKNESLFEKLKHTPLKSNESNLVDPFDVDVEAQTLQHGGFSYYSANESYNNLPVHKNGPQGKKSTVGFAGTSGTFQSRDFSERALPPVPVANGHNTHHHDHHYHHAPQHPSNGATERPAPLASMPSVARRGIKNLPESEELTAAQRHENYNNQLKRLVSTFSSHSLVSVPSDYNIDEEEKVGAIRGTTDTTKRPEVLMKATSPRHAHGRPAVARDISDMSIDHKKGNSEKEREFQMRLGKKSLHSLERTSTHLTRLGTKVKLSQSKYFSGLFSMLFRFC